MPASFSTALGPNVVGGSGDSGCVEGGVLKYGERCSVACAPGYSPSGTSTLLYQCNAAKGGDGDFDVKPAVVCIPGVYISRETRARMIRKIAMPLMSPVSSLKRGYRQASSETHAVMQGAI